MGKANLLVPGCSPDLFNIMYNTQVDPTRLSHDHASQLLNWTNECISYAFSTSKRSKTKKRNLHLTLFGKEGGLYVSICFIGHTRDG